MWRLWTQYVWFISLATPYILYTHRKTEELKEELKEWSKELKIPFTSCYSLWSLVQDVTVLFQIAGRLMASNMATLLSAEASGKDEPASLTPRTCQVAPSLFGWFYPLTQRWMFLSHLMQYLFIFSLKLYSEGFSPPVLLWFGSYIALAHFILQTANQWTAHFCPSAFLCLFSFCVVSFQLCSRRFLSSPVSTLAFKCLQTFLTQLLFFHY